MISQVKKIQLHQNQLVVLEDITQCKSVYNELFVYFLIIQSSLCSSIIGESNYSILILHKNELQTIKNWEYKICQKTSPSRFKRNCSRPTSHCISTSSWIQYLWMVTKCTSCLITGISILNLYQTLHMMALFSIWSCILMNIIQQDHRK